MSMIKAQIFKQEPGADIEPGWYWVRQRPAADPSLPPIPYGTPVGPFSKWRIAERNYEQTKEREDKAEARAALQGAYGHLTPEELCEHVNHMRKRLKYDTTTSYAGNGWYHTRSSGLSFPFKERRHQVEESLRRFEDRFAREEAERPAKEAADRELKARRYLELAAGEMYAALKAIAAQYEGQHIGPAGLAQVRQAIAKAEGRAP